MGNESISSSGDVGSVSRHLSEIGLRDARALRDVARAVVASDIDPRVYRQLDLMPGAWPRKTHKKRLFKIESGTQR